MRKKPGGNGSGKIDIVIQEMRGWFEIRVSRDYDLPDDVHVGMSEIMNQWFCDRPHLRMRCVVPIQKDGSTVAFHVWYDAVLFPPA